jgi:hypothetical protein
LGCLGQFEIHAKDFKPETVPFADPNKMAKMNFSKLLKVPYAFHMLLQLFMYAALSSMHRDKMSTYLDKMASNKLLTIDRLLTIIAYSGILAVCEQLFKITSSTRQLKKTKQLFLLHSEKPRGFIGVTGCVWSLHT